MISSRDTDSRDSQDMESLIRVIGVSAQVVGPRISSIEFLLPGYGSLWLSERLMVVKEAIQEVADGAMQLRGLCLTGKCTYVPEIVTLPHVDHVWYVRIKWRPTGSLSVELETENEAGFTASQHNTWPTALLRTTEKEALKSIIEGSGFSIRDSSRKILDLWLEGLRSGEVRTVHVKIILKDTGELGELEHPDNFLIET